jgi:hypothetical protein
MSHGLERVLAERRRNEKREQKRAKREARRLAKRKQLAQQASDFPLQDAWPIDVYPPNTEDT